LDALWTATSDEVAAGRKAYGELPLVVLTADGTYAGNPPSVRPAIDGLWRALHREIAARSTRGVERLVKHSSHMMMLDQPEAITQAVDAVIADSHAGSEPTH
jgi:hypothetical protein